MKSSRKLRITRRWRTVKYGSGTSVPEIRLCGKWLGHCGFSTGFVVRVEVTENQIILRPG